MQIVPRRSCHISTKMSVLWPSKYAKIRFRRRTPLMGELTTLPHIPKSAEEGTPLPIPYPLGTNPPSALAMRPSRIPARSTPMLATL